MEQAYWRRYGTYAPLSKIAESDIADDFDPRFADDNPVVLDLIGHVHTMLGEYNEALEWYSRAVDGQPRNVAFLVNKANCQMYVGDLEGSKATLGSALQLAPGNSSANCMKTPG